MCGIMGCVGGPDAGEVVGNALLLLQYRGYDSSGLAALHDGSFTVVKKAGRVETLLEACPKDLLACSPCIGHTRWATHGAPCEKNAHPFLSYRKRFALVHNGIIENHLSLRAFLQEKGVVFSSETDSEVVVHLVDYLEKRDTLSSLLGAVSLLKGSFAVCLLSRDEPDRIYFAKKGNPLVAGVENGRGFVCSDVPSVSSYLSYCVPLPDETAGYVTKDSVALFTFDGDPVEPRYVALRKKSALSLSGYAHYMKKEIDEIPDAVARTLNAFPSSLPDELFISVRRVVFLGCGTALHAGMTAKRLLRELLPSLDGYAESAGEFLFEEFPVRDTLFVAVSQSGETADTLCAVKKCRSLGGRVIAVCNVEASSLVREADYVLLTEAGPEISVASTKAYNAQLAVLYAFCLEFVKRFRPEALPPYLSCELLSLPSFCRSVLSSEDVVAAFARQTADVTAVFYVGRGPDYCVAREGSLKLKEISYLPSEAFAAGELKHGTLALLDERVLVVAIATQTAVLDKMATCLAEVRARNAKVLLVTGFFSDKLDACADCIVRLPVGSDLFTSVYAVVPLQLFAYHAALARGRDIDKPRNLAKSVTVE